MSLNSAGRAGSGASSAGLRVIVGVAALFIAFLFAATAGGGGRAVAAICIGGGVFGAMHLDHIMRLPPLGRVIVIVLAGMAILTAAASVIDLEVEGW
jgi:hypothetical protein